MAAAASSPQNSSSTAGGGGWRGPSGNSGAPRSTHCMLLGRASHLHTASRPAPKLVGLQGEYLVRTRRPAPGQVLTSLHAAQVGLGLEPSGLVSTQQQAIGQLAGRLGCVDLCRQAAAGGPWGPARSAPCSAVGLLQRRRSSECPPKGLPGAPLAPCPASDSCSPARGLPTRATDTALALCALAVAATAAPRVWKGEAPQSVGQGSDRWPASAWAGLHCHQTAWLAAHVKMSARQGALAPHACEAQVS